MKIRVENKKCFEDMIRNNEIKKEWSQIELYGIDSAINAAFKDNIDNEDIAVATCCNKGVLEAYLYEGIEYHGIHVDRAYIHINNDIILTDDCGSKILIVENENTKVSDFASYGNRDIK